MTLKKHRNEAAIPRATPRPNKTAVNKGFVILLTFLSSFTLDFKFSPCFKCSLLSLG
jgi:hypothetical protein